jgi:quercetin 2,3-dioxygenase
MTVLPALHDAKVAEVGGFTVRRALPRRGLRTVGAWCFADHMGPEVITPSQGLDVGPHPHIGLHTVTWLMEGAVLHTDSLGSEQLIRPGQLNLMTAGNGIAHAEEADRVRSQTLHGLQLWIAQPDATRQGASAFAHHSTLPRVDLGIGSGTVLIGEFGDVISDAKVETDLVGVDAELTRGATTWGLRPDYEYALYVVGGAMHVNGITAGEGQLCELGIGLESLTLTVDGTARVLLLGGQPFDEKLYMWWNFVGRSQGEILRATQDWSGYGHSDEAHARFGHVRSRLTPIQPMSRP